MSKSNTRLHHALPVSGQKHNGYCGPAAIAALTGVSTGEAARLLRDVSGRPWIKGASENIVLDVLASLGLDVVDSYRIYPMKIMTLQRWIRERWTGELALVVAMNHYWAFDGGYFCDSFNRLPTPVDQIHNPKSFVSSVYYLD